jgi:hypothetical protein
MYELMRISEDEFHVIKFDHGMFPEQDYSVVKKGVIISCNCIAGKIHKVCKHGEWVKSVLKGKVNELPEGVKLVRQVDGVKIRDNFLKNLLKVKEMKKRKVKV